LSGNLTMFEINVNDFIENLRNGKLWIAYLLLFVPIIYSYIKKDYNKNPRQKSLPFWYVGIILIILIFNSIELFSIKYTWLSISASTLVFAYIYLVNSTLKVSYEYYLIKSLEKKLLTQDIDDYTDFYVNNRKLFISQLGKYRYGLMCLHFMHNQGIYPLCFDIMDDIQKLQLTDEEKRVFLIQQFNIYCDTQAARSWENKYDSIKHLLKEEDKLYVESILAYQKLNLDLSEELNQKLLATTSNALYKQIAENNLAVIAENRSENIDWSDYSQKSFATSQQIKSNIDTASINLIFNFLHSGNTEKAEKLYQNYIKLLPAFTTDQRIHIANVQLIYYRQKGDTESLEKVIGTLFDEYHRASKSKRYPFLISLLRICFNHDILFEEVLSEVERKLDDILETDFSLIQWVTNEILGIASSRYGSQDEERIIALMDKCIKKLDTVDIDHEIAKLRNENVVKKRSYIKFKAKIATLNLTIPSFEQYIKQLSEKLKILDQLILFDEKHSLTMNLLDSLFLKLDEVTCAMDVIINVYRIATQSETFIRLYEEGYRLIAKILPIMNKAENALMIAEYHLRLAHYYCCLNNSQEGYKHFLKFKERGINLLNFADWLQEWYDRLERYFSNESFSNR
jgi:hypothetical protein